MKLLTRNKPVAFSSAESLSIGLEDGRTTSLHVVKYRHNEVKPRLKLFEKETNLLDWCDANEVSDAIGGGFFLRNESKPLGEMWINGIKQATVDFAMWPELHGSICINEIGSLAIGPRYGLPPVPAADLLQAGPLLVRKGRNAIISAVDPEGFSAGAAQFDSDITVGRYPRAAIGTDDEHIFSVVCDGRSDDEAGMTLAEFADSLTSLGVKDALNLDGGSSACLISQGQLRNVARSDDAVFERGRPIFSAILFEAA